MNHIKGNSCGLTPAQRRSLPGSPDLLCIPSSQREGTAILTFENITSYYFFMFYHL